MEPKELISSGKSTDDELLEVVIPDGTTKLNNQKRRIGKVPMLLRNHENNKGEYDPKVVSIGPYHHGKSELSLVENLKPMVARVFVSDSGKDMDEFYNKVLLMVDDARRFYVEGSTNKYSDAQFAEMMLLDGCFILGMIENNVAPGHYVKYSEVKSHFGMLVSYSYIADIVFLLENQLPFQVLELLMCLKFKENNEWINIIHAFLALRTSLDEQYVSKDVETSEYEQPPLHLLDLFRTKLLFKLRPLAAADNQGHHKKRTLKKKLFSTSFAANKVIQKLFRRGTYPDEQCTNIKRIYRSFRSVTELKAKGIHFTPSNSTSFKAMIFKSFCFYGELELPQFLVTPRTKIMLLNMVAYELCPDNPNDLGITSYVAFMKSLIDHPDDVKELRSKHILLNVLGSDEEVANVYKEINTFAVEDSEIYNEVKQRIEDHYHSKAKTWMAELIHKYFSSPWTVVAFAAATSVVVLTFIQTYLAFFPRSDK